MHIAWALASIDDRAFSPGFRTIFDGLAMTQCVFGVPAIQSRHQTWSMYQSIVMPSWPHSNLYQADAGVHRHCSLDRSDFRYTFRQCTDLQSPVICLDNGGIVAQHAAMQGYVRLCNSLKCIEKHLGGYLYCHGKYNCWFASSWEKLIAFVADS